VRINVIVPINKKSLHRRLAELEQASIEEICGFLTSEEIKKYLRIELKNVTVKVIKRPKHQSKEYPISIQIHSETAGFPMTCKCTDIKRGLIESIKKMADLAPNQNTESVMGITPLLVEKVAEKITDDRPE